MGSDLQFKLLPLVQLARRARGREAIPKVLWESRLVMRATAGIGVLPVFTGMAKGPCMVPHLMEDGEIWPGWRARWEM